METFVGEVYPKILYNPQMDILSVQLTDISNSEGNSENNSGFLVLKDKDTNETTGFTIIGVHQKYQTHTLPAIPDGCALDYFKDIFPYLTKEYGFMI